MKRIPNLFAIFIRTYPIGINTSPKIVLPSSAHMHLSLNRHIYLPEKTAEMEQP